MTIYATVAMNKFTQTIHITVNLFPQSLYSYLKFALFYVSLFAIILQVKGAAI